MSYEFGAFLGFFLPILIAFIAFDMSWYSRPIKIDYYFKSKRFKTKNILTGRVQYGFDEKYKRSTRVYLLLTNDRVVIAPFYSLRKSYILYNKIIKFDIVLKEPQKDYVVELDEHRFPRNIRDLEYIEITYMADNGAEDIVVIELKYFLFWLGQDRNYKFNKYVYSKCKVFNIVKNQINDKFIQSYYTSGRTFKENIY